MQPDFQVDEELIRQVTEVVWESLVGGSIAPSGGAQWKAVAQFVTARVEVEGPWRGSVAVHCPPALARRVAEAMFAARTLCPDEVRDALGELANVVGGNLKPLLPGPSVLSTPNTSLPGGTLDEVRQGAPQRSVWFEFAGEPVVVELVARGGAREPGRGT